MLVSTYDLGYPHPTYMAQPVWIQSGPTVDTQLDSQSYRMGCCEGDVISAFTPYPVDLTFPAYRFACAAGARTTSSADVNASSSTNRLPLPLISASSVRRRHLGLAITCYPL